MREGAAENEGKNRRILLERGDKVAKGIRVMLFHSFLLGCGERDACDGRESGLPILF
jgi:hypothetical protein